MFLIMRRWQQCSDLHSDLFEINGKLQQAGDRQLKCANTHTPTPPSSIPYPSRKHSMLPLYCKYSNTHKRHKTSVLFPIEARGAKTFGWWGVRSRRIKYVGEFPSKWRHHNYDQRELSKRQVHTDLHSLYGMMKMSSN